MEGLASVLKSLWCIKPEGIHIFHSWGKDVLMKGHPVYQEFISLNGNAARGKIDTMPLWENCMH